MRLAITGFPTAMASMTAWPKPSECEAEANPWRAWIALVDLGGVCFFTPLKAFRRDACGYMYVLRLKSE